MIVIRLSHFSLFFAVALFWACLLAYAVPSAHAEQQGGLNYEEADIRTLIDDIARRTGRSFVLDPRLQGTVSIYSPEQAVLTNAEIWEMFLTTLQVNNFIAVPITASEYKIVPIQQTAREPGQGFGIGKGNETITRIIRLRVVEARNAASALKVLSSERGAIVPVPETNAVILVDNAANMKRLLETARRIDQDTSIIRTISLENAFAVDVVTVLGDMLNKQLSNLRNVLPLSIVPIVASNSVLIRGNKTEVEHMIAVIRQLDVAPSSMSNLSVMHLRHADAQTLAPLLTEIVKDGIGIRNGGARETRSTAMIAVYEQNNALIINADQDTTQRIKALVTQLDVRQAQVLIEALIVNMSENAARDLGLQYLAAGEDIPFVSTSYNNAQADLFATAGAAFVLSENKTQTVTTVDSSGNPVTRAGERVEIPGASRLVETAISSLFAVNGLALGSGIKADNGNIFGAILTAVQSDTDSNILSTPSVVTLDNTQARLQVGQEIPITTGEAVGSDLTNAFRTVARQEVGVILTVKPQISDEDTVRMEITQEVSSIVGAVTRENADLITNKAVITTQALAEDGEILVIGGLIDTNEQDTDNKVPYLGDIPLLGRLFKATSHSNSKQTLLVFIRPTILRTPADSRTITGKKYHYIRAQQMLRNKNRQPMIDKVLADVLDQKDFRDSLGDSSTRPKAVFEQE